MPTGLYSVSTHKPPRLPHSDRFPLKFYKKKVCGTVQDQNPCVTQGVNYGNPLGGDGKFAGLLNLSRLRLAISALRILSMRIW